MGSSMGSSSPMAADLQIHHVQHGESTHPHHIPTPNALAHSAGRTSAPALTSIPMQWRKCKGKATRPARDARRLPSDAARSPNVQRIRAPTLPLGGPYGTAPSELFLNRHNLPRCHVEQSKVGDLELGHDVHRQVSASLAWPHLPTQSRRTFFVIRASCRLAEGD